MQEDGRNIRQLICLSLGALVANFSISSHLVPQPKKYKEQMQMEIAASLSLFMSRVWLKQGCDCSDAAFTPSFPMPNHAPCSLRDPWQH